MTVQEITHRLNRTNPTTVEDLLVECGFTMKFIASGQFRAAFDIGSGLVVKVPFHDDKGSCIAHANSEYEMYQKIMRSRKKYAYLKPYLPKVIFHSDVSGVTVVEKCKPLQWVPRKFEETIVEIDEFCTDNKVGIKYLSEGKWVFDSDLGLDKFDNFGVAKDGSLKILDIATGVLELE